MPIVIVQHRSPSYSSRTLKLYHRALSHLLDSLRFSFKVTEISREMSFKEISELRSICQYHIAISSRTVTFIQFCHSKQLTIALFPNPFLFHEGTPKIIINIPRHLQQCKRIEARTNLIPGSAIQKLNYGKFTVLPISGQNFPRYFEGCSEFFAEFQRFYPFIYSRTLAKPLTMFRGTVVGKHRSILMLRVPSASTLQPKATPTSTSFSLRLQNYVPDCLWNTTCLVRSPLNIHRVTCW